MNFSMLTKTIDTNNYIERVIDINQIKAQYNPERFKFWKSLHKGPEEEVLNMVYSPHYRFLNQYIEQNKNTNKSSYYKLQKLYGRNNEWIQNKITKFTSLFNSIQNEGCKIKVILLNKPLVKNKYNNGFEIFEGHHRVACCLILGIRTITCKLIEGTNVHY